MSHVKLWRVRCYKSINGSAGLSPISDSPSSISVILEVSSSSEYKLYSFLIGLRAFMTIVFPSIFSISSPISPNILYYIAYLTIQTISWLHIYQRILPSSNLDCLLPFPVFLLLHCLCHTLSQTLLPTLVHSPNFPYSPKYLLLL